MREKITINISKNVDLTEEVCKAFERAERINMGIFSSVKPSQTQDIYAMKKSTEYYNELEWKSQLGIMLG